MDLETLFDRYEAIHYAARNYAPKTRGEYSRDVGNLVRFLAARGVGDARAVTLDDLETYLAHLEGRGLSGTSRRRMTAAIKTFFRFLEHHDHIATNPAGRLIPPKAESRDPASSRTRSTGGSCARSRTSRATPPSSSWCSRPASASPSSRG